MRDPTANAAQDQRRVSAIAGRIYGLIVVGAALAVARPGAQSRWSVLVDVGAAALIYSAAHAYAVLLGERVLARRTLTWAERRAIAAPEFMILRATALPFVALLACGVVGADTATSVDVAIAVLIVELVVTSWITSRGIDSIWLRVGYAGGALGLGLLLIGLKVITH